MNKRTATDNISIVNRKNKRYTVLVIENDAQLRSEIITHLKNEGYTTEESATCLESSDDLLKIMPDVIIASIESGSFEQIESLIAFDIPVIIMGDNSDINPAVKAMNDGACFFIQKPLNDLLILEPQIQKCILSGIQKRQKQLYINHLEEELKRKDAENELKNYQLARLNRGIKQLMDKAHSTPSLSGVNELCPDILNDFGSHLQASGGSIYIKEEKGLRLAHSLEHKHAPDFLPFPLKEGSPFQHVLETGKPVLIDNIDSKNGLCKSGWSGYNDSSFMIFPIPDHEGGISALLSLHNKKAPPFITEDREMGNMISSFYGEVGRAMNAIESMRLCESRYEAFTENSSAIVFSYSIASEVFDFFNGSLESVTGCEKSEVLNRGIENFVEKIGIVEKEDFVSHFESLISGQINGSGLDYRITTSDGEHKKMFQRTSLVFDSEGFPVFINGVITEFSDPNESIQIEADERMKSKISALQIIHSSLYDEETAPVIKMDSYINRLVENLKKTDFYNMTLQISIDAANVTMRLDKSVICGLIISEAVANSFSHALMYGTADELSISLKTDNKSYILKLNDYGTGAVSLDSELDLIKILSQQLDGNVDFRENGETVLVIEFPVK